MNKDTSGSGKGVIHGYQPLKKMKKLLEMKEKDDIDYKRLTSGRIAFVVKTVSEINRSLYIYISINK